MIMSIDKDIRLSLKEIISGQINDLLLLIRSSGQNQPILVHELRKGIKRVRSLFHLFKPVISDQDFHEINKMICELGSTLTYQRESIVNIQIFNELEHIFTRFSNKNTLVLINELLNNQNAEAYENTKNEFNRLITGISFNLSKVRENINNLKINPYSADLLKLAIIKNFSKTKRYYNDCKISSHMEAVHKWRRYCKYLLFQLKFGPIDFIDQQYTDKLDNLAEILGKEHDLAVFDQLLKVFIFKEIDRQDRLIISQYLDDERNELQKKAFKLGKEIFSEKVVISKPEPVLF